MVSSEQTCIRCGHHLTDGDPRVWLTLQSANLGYEPLDDEHVVCETCYDAYRDFIDQSVQQSGEYE